MQRPMQMQPNTLNYTDRKRDSKMSPRKHGPRRPKTAQLRREKRIRNSDGWIWCSRGQHYQPREEFYRRCNCDKPGILFAWCKECTRAYVNERRQRARDALREAMQNAAQRAAKKGAVNSLVTPLLKSTTLTEKVGLLTFLSIACC